MAYRRRRAPALSCQTTKGLSTLQYREEQVEDRRYREDAHGDVESECANKLSFTVEPIPYAVALEEFPLASIRDPAAPVLCQGPRRALWRMQNGS